MTEAHKEAAKQSKDGAIRYVVYVLDNGYDVYTAAQHAKWGAFFQTEAAYLNGAKVVA